MEGLRKSRANDWGFIWWLLGGGTVVFFLSRLDAEATERNRLEREREKAQSSVPQAPTRAETFNYECCAEKMGEETILCELQAIDDNEAKAKSSELRGLMIGSGKKKYDDVDWSTFRVRAKH